MGTKNKNKAAAKKARSGASKQDEVVARASETDQAGEPVVSEAIEVDQPTSEDVPEIQVRADESDAGQEAEPVQTEDAVFDPAGEQMTEEPAPKTPEVFDAVVVEPEPEREPEPGTVTLPSGQVLDAEIVSDEPAFVAGTITDPAAVAEFERGLPHVADDDAFAPSEQPAQITAPADRAKTGRVSRKVAILSPEFKTATETLLGAIRNAIRHDDTDALEIKLLQVALDPFETEYEKLSTVPDAAPGKTGVITRGPGLNRAVDEFGHHATALLRYLGSRGFKTPQAKARLAEFGICPNDGTIRAQVEMGRKASAGEYTRAKLPTLTPEQAAKLEGKQNDAAEEVTGEQQAA